MNMNPYNYNKYTFHYPNTQTLQMTPLPNAPWEQVSVDFCEVPGHYVLVVIDDYSRFPEIEIVHSTSAKVVIPKLDHIFAAYGITQVAESDHGPPLMVMSSHNLLSILVSSTEKCPHCGLKPMEKWNAL